MYYKIDNDAADTPDYRMLVKVNSLGEEEDVDAFDECIMLLDKLTTLQRNKSQLQVLLNRVTKRYEDLKQWIVDMLMLPEEELEGTHE